MPKRAVLLPVAAEFGRGRILNPDAGRLRKKVLVRLLCAADLGGCGAEYEATAAALRAGLVKSCGCLHREAPALVAATRTHGLTRHPLYGVWSGVIARCENPARPAYRYYGGRATDPVTLWGPWRDPARFIADVLAEIGPRPAGTTPGGMPAWTLNRKDNRRGYEPGNIEWADWHTQRVNRLGG
jgi:hypothetical protein